MTVIAVHAHVAGPVLRRAKVVPYSYQEVTVPNRKFVIPCGYINLWIKSRTFMHCAFSAHSGTPYCLRHQATIARHPCLQDEVDTNLANRERPRGTPPGEAIAGDHVPPSTEGQS